MAHFELPTASNDTINEVQLQWLTRSHILVTIVLCGEYMVGPAAASLTGTISIDGMLQKAFMTEAGGLTSLLGKPDSSANGIGNAFLDQQGNDGQVITIIGVRTVLGGVPFILYP